MFFVLNALRPDTSNIEDVKSLAANIEYMSRAKITGIINNTNLSYLSESGHLKGSMGFAEEVSKTLGCDIKYITGTKEMLLDIDSKYKDKLMEIELFMKLPFDAMA